VVRGGEQCGPGVAFFEVVDDGAAAVDPDGRRGHADRGERLAEEEQAVRLHGDRAGAGEDPAEELDGVPAQITIESGVVRTPRTLPRYCASASRSSTGPRGSPIRNASWGAPASARRVDASHAVLGNSATSGEPGSRLCVGMPGTPLGRAGSGAARLLTTQVPAPWREASQPSATSSA
jgi:hypothetical protein